MLAEWSRWLHADVALTSLAAILPDHFFASTTHLNESGARAYTDAFRSVLAESLR